MHYYKHNIGDYRRRTTHLSILEHGIYRQLLDQYYLDESKLPADIVKIKRLLCVRSADEKQALEIILDEFFTLSDDGYSHSYADKEISKYHDKSAKAAAAAAARWAKNDKNKADGMRTHSESNANAERTECQPLTTNHKPLVKDNSPLPTASRLTCPHQEIINAYHKYLPTSPAVKIWSDARKRKLQARWREDAQRQTVEYWEGLFKYMSSIPFLSGKTEPPFRPNLEWIVTPANFIKIIEGNYDD